MPKITFKKAFFRIFWKILAKTGPQSLYLCGFPEASVEMEVAPFRALTRQTHAFVTYRCTRRNGGRPFQGIDTFTSAKVNPLSSRSGRNGGRPIQGIDTFLRLGSSNYLDIVEMEVAPFRALTHFYCFDDYIFHIFCRNGGRPIQGIDTGYLPEFL